MAGQALDDLAGLSDAIGAWHVGNCDGGTSVGQHATGGSADGTCSTNDQRNIASERFGIGHSGPHLIGGLGNTASPGSMTNVYAKVNQGPLTFGAGAGPEPGR